MKTNFLHFKSIGSQTFVYSAGAQTFTINGAEFWDVAITNKNQVTVTVIDATDGSSNDIAQAGLSLSTNDLTIAAASSSGFDLGAGDIVTISVIPTEDTEALFRADRFLGIEADGATADTLVVLSFKSMKSVAAAAGDDTVTFTITDDGGVKNMKDICQGVLEALNSDRNGGVVTVLDRLNKTGTLNGVGTISKMVIAVA